MRDIEFRGYDPDTKRWYYGSYVALEKNTVNPWGSTQEDYDNNVEHFIYFTQSTDWSLPTRKMRATVDPKSVGQYVGERDRKGNKIYEGDVIILGDDRAVVKYEYLEFVAMSIEPNVHGNVSTWCNLLKDSAEVVGNIYEKETQ